MLSLVIGVGIIIGIVVLMVSGGSFFLLQKADKIRRQETSSCSSSWHAPTFECLCCLRILVPCRSWRVGEDWTGIRVRILYLTRNYLSQVCQAIGKSLGVDGDCSGSQDVQERHCSRRLQDRQQCGPGLRAGEQNTARVKDQMIDLPIFTIQILFL